jgi:hypothetical protein
MSPPIDNERTKLLANALDRASTACLTVGVVAPFAAALYNFGGVAIHGSWCSASSFGFRVQSYYI